MVFHMFFQDLHGVFEKNLKKLRYSDGKNAAYYCCRLKQIDSQIFLPLTSSYYLFTVLITYIIMGLISPIR